MTNNLYSNLTPTFNLSSIPIDNGKVRYLKSKDFTAVIFDDNLLAVKNLSKKIREVSTNIKIERHFTRLEDLIEYYQHTEKQPDLLFTEVNSVNNLIFDLIKFLDVKSNIIFTTFYKEYAVDAFRVNAVDYLIKPIQIDQLKIAIDKFLVINTEKENDKPKNQYNERIILKWANKFHMIKCNEIAYIVSRNKVSYVYNHKGDRIPSGLKLQSFEDILDPSKFFKANRQFIVNYDFILDIKTLPSTKLEIRLPNFSNEIVKMSAARTKAFKKWINR